MKKSSVRFARGIVYDLPEIVAVPVSDGLPEYLRWIATETSGEIV